MNRHTPAYRVALGGILAALAVIFQSLGGLIPVATYVTPMLCCILLNIVASLCGRRIGWAWFGAVAILSLLMAPDKEAAAVFACLGCYPLLKPFFDKSPISYILKAVFFNAVILALYWALLHLFGLASVREDLSDLNTAGLIVLLLLGNFTFFTLDRMLSMPKWKGERRGR